MSEETAIKDQVETIEVSPIANDEISTVKSEEPAPVTKAKPFKSWVLPESGMKVACKKGFAKHAQEASLMMGGNPANYNFAMMAVLLTFNGDKWAMEKLLVDLPLQDFMFLLAELQELNFI